MPSSDRLPPNATPEVWAHWWLDRLEHALNHGLPPVYRGSWYDWLADALGGDTPWTPDVNAAFWAAAQADPRYAELSRRLEAAYGQKGVLHA